MLRGLFEAGRHDGIDDIDDCNKAFDRVDDRWYHSSVVEPAFVHIKLNIPDVALAMNE